MEAMTHEMLQLIAQMDEGATSAIDALRRQFGVDSTRPTLLHFAVKHGNVSVVRYLLIEGFDINAQDESGNTALMEAVHLGELQTVQVLLDHGADPYALDHLNRSPIHYLYLYDIEHTEEKVQILRILLDLGVSLMPCTDEGTFQLSCTLVRGNREGIRAILQSNIDLHVRDSDGLNAMHYIALNCNPGVTEELEQHAISFDVNAIDKIGITPLYLAVTQGNTAMVEFLLGRHADSNSLIPHRKNYSQLFMVYYESSEGSEETYDQCAELLLQNGADPQYIVTEGDSVLTVFDLVSKGDCSLRMRPVVARLALRERCGTLISDVILSKIEEHGLQEYLEQCRGVLDERVTGQVTILQLMSDPISKLARYVDCDLLPEFNRLKELNLSYPHYYETAHKRLIKSIDYKGAAAAICNIFDSLVDETHLVTRQVITYFDNNDLRALCEYSQLYINE